MSKVSQLRKMFQQKAKEQNNVPPMKPLPKKPAVQQPKQKKEEIIQKKQENEKKPQGVVTEQNSRVSVAEMRKNLQAKIKFNQGTMDTNVPKQKVQIKQEPSVKMPQRNQTVQENQKIPSFKQARQKLQRLQQQKSLKKQQEERKKKQQKEGKKIQLQQRVHIYGKEDQNRQHENKQEQKKIIKKQSETSLNLRQKKSQKRNLGNFDDF